MSEDNYFQTPKSKEVINKGMKRDRSHMTPEMLVRINKKKREFFQEHGESIYLHIFKANLTPITTEEMATMQNNLLEKELSGELDIEVTKHESNAIDRSLKIRIHNTEERKGEIMSFLYLIYNRIVTI